MGNHAPNSCGPSTVRSKSAIPIDDSKFGSAYFTATWETGSGTTKPDGALNPSGYDRNTDFCGKRNECSKR